MKEAERSSACSGSSHTDSWSSHTDSWIGLVRSRHSIRVSVIAKACTDLYDRARAFGQEIANNSIDRAPWRFPRDTPEQSLESCKQMT